MAHHHHRSAEPQVVRDRAPRLGAKLDPLLQRKAEQLEIGELEQQIGLLGDLRRERLHIAFGEIFS